MNKNKNDIERYKWETDEEYRYRMKTSKIMSKVGNALKQISIIAKTKKRDFTSIYDAFKQERTSLEGLDIPKRYIMVNEFLSNCLDSYVEAGRLLINGVSKVDSKITYKSARYIEEGNCWLSLSKIRIWESIENEYKEND